MTAREAMRSALAETIRMTLFEARASGLSVHDIQAVHLLIARELAGIDENDGWVRRLVGGVQ